MARIGIPQDQLCCRVRKEFLNHDSSVRKWRLPEATAPVYAEKWSALKSMYRRLLSLIFLSLFAASAVAQFQTPSVRLGGRTFLDLATSQKILLSNYCRLDFEGARLQSEGWNRFKPYTTLRANPDFNRVVVVTRYDVETPDHPTDVVSVNYQEVGYFQDEEGYQALPSNDQVSFRMQEKQGTLMVTEIKPEVPHVSPRAAIAWMNQRLADPKLNDLERAHLKEAVNQLSKIGQPRPAANIP